ncbi:hypothetical protein RF11_06651 [Thelohanellus kitauei]|uniref:Tc1-like transposase DDE domain-containing protein n=1 Tax=Thelohanellus kitauei TaxID=669202 RepID=A0A0C2J6H9_THEKT|nr:hypothetical protein RF11_06651 [Thelohanellus kitauei]
MFLERTNITISKSAAARRLKEFQNTLKIIRVISERRNDTSTILWSKEYAIKFLRIAIDRHKIFFLDETGFQINRFGQCGRSSVGVLETGTVSALRMKNYSVWCTMQSHVIVNLKYFRGSTVKRSFKSISQMFSSP